VNYNLKLNDLIRNIVSKGFSVDIVAPWYIPSSKEVEKAKTIFLRRKSDIIISSILMLKMVEDEDGPNPTQPAHWQQIVC